MRYRSGFKSWDRLLANLLFWPQLTLTSKPPIGTHVTRSFDQLNVGEMLQLAVTVADPLFRDADAVEDCQQ